MPASDRATLIRFRAVQSTLALVGIATLACATTPPLVLQPTIRPLDFAPAEKLPRLHLISFADDLPEYEGGFMMTKKQFRDPPVNVFNDALLSSLRLSEGFEAVDRDQPPTDSGYILEGRLLALDTQESFFKTQVDPSTMDIGANCVAEFQLKDARTGEVLLADTVIGTGEGWTEVDDSGVSISHTIDTSGRTSTSTTQNTANYDVTTGYQHSMGAAISNSVHQVTELIVKRLSILGPSNGDTLAEETP